MSLGFSDLPVVNKEDDIFEVSNYVNALRLNSENFVITSAIARRMRFVLVSKI